MKRYIVYINGNIFIGENRLSEANCEAYMHSDEGVVIIVDNLTKQIVWTNEVRQIA